MDSPAAVRKLTIPEALRSRPAGERVSDTTIRRAIREGRLPAERFLNRYLIDEEDLEFFLRRKAVALPATREAVR